MASTTHQQSKRIRLTSTSAGGDPLDVIESLLEDDDDGPDGAGRADETSSKDLIDDLNATIGTTVRSTTNGGGGGGGKRPGESGHKTGARFSTARNSRVKFANAAAAAAADDVDNLSDETDDGLGGGAGDDDDEDTDSSGDEEEEDDDDEDEEEADEDDDDDDDDDDEDFSANGKHKSGKRPKKQRHRHKTSQSEGNNNNNNNNGSNSNNSQQHSSLQRQLAASGPAGVAAAAAIATVRRRRRPHTFETNPSVRKRQQTRLIRKLRACIDEYTARVGQQAVVLITMPGKTAHNFKVFGAQPLESVVRSCKQEIMSELEQAVLEQTPVKLGGKEDHSGKHELPPLVIDGIPTPVEKMTQAQLRAFIPLMLKYSTGRGKPGWGKDSTRPAWWPNTLPWANVRSDARDDASKQNISWTTTLREIVTNCYKFHGREDLLPIFDEENDEPARDSDDGDDDLAGTTTTTTNSTTTEVSRRDGSASRSATNGKSSVGDLVRSQRPLGSAATRSTRQQRQQQQQLQQQQLQQHHQGQQLLQVSTGSGELYQAYETAGGQQGNFMQTIQNADGTMSLIQVDPASAQILTLPDGTQVRAVRLQTMTGSDGAAAADGHGQLVATSSGELHTISDPSQFQQQQHHHQNAGELHQLVEGQQAEMGPDGQIILTSEDGTQSCYPMSQLVSIPASVYQQFAASGQPLQIISADGTSLTTANAIQIHTLEEPREISAQEAADNQEAVDQLQQVVVESGSGGKLEGEQHVGEASNSTHKGPNSERKPASEASKPASERQRRFFSRN